MGRVGLGGRGKWGGWVRRGGQLGRWALRLKNIFPPFDTNWSKINS